MSVADPAPRENAKQRSAKWKCTPEEVKSLSAAVERFLKNPAESNAEATLLTAIEEIAHSAPGGNRAVRKVRATQLKKLGRYSMRYVLLKQIQEDGSLQQLDSPKPARDEIPKHWQALIEQNRERFPQGLDQFLNVEKPLVRASSEEFKRLLAKSAQQRVQELPDTPGKLAAQKFASLLDMLLAYRHCFLQTKDAHPTALEKIDTDDVETMFEFLISAGKKTPLTNEEFARFIQLAGKLWEGGTDQDTILRGRIVHTALKGIPGVMEHWVTPFVRELASRGKLQSLYSRFLRRPRSAHPRSQLGPAPAQQQASSQPRPLEFTPSADDTSMGDDTGYDMEIPIGATPPERLHILRTYLEISSISSVVSLKEAMKMSAADAESAGHRQYVLLEFKRQGWVLIRRGKREPMFEKRPDVPGTASDLPEADTIS